MTKRDLRKISRQASAGFTLVELLLVITILGILAAMVVPQFTGQGEALVGWRDPFYALKKGFKDLFAFSTVWGPVCYLARFPRFTYVAGETFRANLEIRNLTEKPLEAGAVHHRCGLEFLTITPGIRFADAAADDQVRITTPARAREIGSDFIVVGRPITAAPDPVAAYERCIKEFV